MDGGGVAKRNITPTQLIIDKCSCHFNYLICRELISQGGLV